MYSKHEFYQKKQIKEEKKAKSETQSVTGSEWTQVPLAHGYKFKTPTVKATAVKSKASRNPNIPVFSSSARDATPRR